MGQNLSCDGVVVSVPLQLPPLSIPVLLGGKWGVGGGKGIQLRSHGFALLWVLH